MQCPSTVSVAYVGADPQNFCSHVKTRSILRGRYLRLPVAVPVAVYRSGRRGGVIAQPQPFNQVYTGFRYEVVFNSFTLSAIDQSTPT